MAVTVYTPSPALNTQNTNTNINFRQFVKLSQNSNGQLRFTFQAGPGASTGTLNVSASFGKWDGQRVLQQ